ncbi:uncharacterized protein [Lolium perenne]|jgi:hypothetical protein|uniref:uncharacterized protein n=1 Tax=Lolium perenne TaxID=4522 RepID=UPI0021F5ADE3|nr:uncharacterized protein LOC127298176 [Lolium perenne]
MLAVRGNTVSAEEKSIREELEEEIERDLEQEIIDQMFRLTRRLQSLYQHKDRRELINGSPSYIYQWPTANAILSEMNISVRLDGQCRIDITKVEQHADPVQVRSWPDTDPPEKRKGSPMRKRGIRFISASNKTIQLCPGDK